MLIERSRDRFHSVKRFSLSFIEKVSGEERTLLPERLRRRPTKFIEPVEDQGRNTRRLHVRVKHSEDNPYPCS